MMLTQYQIMATAEESLSLPMEALKAIPGIIGPVLWNYEQGPAENILGWVDLGVLLLGGGIITVISIVANVFGISFSELGRLIDKTMGWKTFADMASASLDHTIQKLTGLGANDLGRAMASFKSSPMSAFGGTERNAYDGIVHTARGWPRTRPQRRPHKKPDRDREDDNKSSRQTPQQKFDDEIKMKQLHKNYKEDKSFTENFTDLISNGGGILSILSKITKTKFSVGLVIVSLLAFVKWLLSMAISVGKLAFFNKRTGIAAVVGGAALASTAYFKWFAGDDADEEAINKGVEGGAHIFGEKVRKSLEVLAPENRNFRGAIEHLIDGVMIK